MFSWWQIKIPGHTGLNTKKTAPILKAWKSGSWNHRHTILQYVKTTTTAYSDVTFVSEAAAEKFSHRDSELFVFWCFPALLWRWVFSLCVSFLNNFMSFSLLCELSLHIWCHFVHAALLCCSCVDQSNFCIHIHVYVILSSCLSDCLVAYLSMCTCFPNSFVYLNLSLVKLFRSDYLILQASVV